MDNAVIIALLTIAVPSVLAAVGTPIIVAVVQSKNKRQDAEIAAKAKQEEKEAEWKRSDMLEQRATERAAAVAKRAEETSRLLVNATINVRDLTTTLNSKADEIHVLVNSSYTAALQATLAAMRATLVALLDSVAFKREQKMEVPPEATAEINTTLKKMEELSAIIDERLRHDALAKEVKAAELLLGKQQAASSISKDQPLPVEDDRNATATERTAAASERVADATERSAEATIAKIQENSSGKIK